MGFSRNSENTPLHSLGTSYPDVLNEASHITHKDIQTLSKIAGNRSGNGLISPPSQVSLVRQPEFGIPYLAVIRLAQLSFARSSAL